MVEYVYPGFPDTVEGAPLLPETLEPNVQPIEPRQVPQAIKRDEPPVIVERPEPFIISVTPEPERVDEPLGPTYPIPAPLEPTASDQPPATAESPDPIRDAKRDVLDEPPVITGGQGSIAALVGPSGKDAQKVDIPTVSVPQQDPAAWVEPATSAPGGQPTQRSEPSFGHWSDILSEIKQKIEPLASSALQRLPPLDQVCVSRPALLWHILTIHNLITERTSQSRFPASYRLAPTLVLRLTFYS